MLNRSVLVLAAMAAFYTLASGHAHAEFYATQDLTGEILVTDENGAPVPVVTGDPVGTRADICPDGAYYVAALPTDMSQLVLTDCATDTEHHSVEPQD
jgi:hypothetical protein